MSLNNSDLVVYLKQNPRLFREVCVFIKTTLAAEVENLHSISERALLNESVKNTALMQLGKVEFLREVDAFLHHCAN